MTIARLTDGLSTVGELIEYPSELEGGRNLLPNSKLIEHDKETNQQLNVDWEEGTYTISFDYELIEENENITSFLLYSYADGVGSFARVPLKKEGEKRTGITFEVTKAMTESTIHLYAGSSAAASRANVINFIEVKVEKGNKATPWTPAPEDLGLDYPDWVQNFTTSFSEHGIITQEFIEGENTSLSNKIKTKHLKEGGL